MHWLPAILMIPYFILIVRICRSLQKIKPFTVKDKPAYFVSVVIACRNEEADLPHLLTDISKQEYPHNKFEVIIVDDNSTDSTNVIASGFREISNMQVIRNMGNGKKQALRTGIGIAKGDLIITTDADCKMGPNWIRTITAFYADKSPDMIICPVQIEQIPGFFGRFQELEFLSLQGITAGTSNYGNSTMCNGANLAFKKEAYYENLENLRFDILTGDDVFFLHSLKKKAGSVILWLESSDATVTTSGSSCLKDYLEQRKRWLSKSSAYNDFFSISLGTVTFTAILTELFVMAAAVYSSKFLPVFLVIFLLKSVADYLILRNTAIRYEKKKLLNWFLPAQIVYPVYVIAVVVYAVFSPVKREISSPSPKGI
jgi:cellulose synthase/poly-beta-1,6-N-acetylglucosamine synthase-like glycosyltransferase